MSRSTRRTLVSHKLRDINTGTPELDRQLNEAFRDHTAQVFEKIRYFDTYTPDHEITGAEAAAGVTPTNREYPPGHYARYGGVGDGVTDDSAAVQAVFTLCADHDGYLGIGKQFNCPTAPVFPARNGLRVTATNSIILCDGEGITHSLVSGTTYPVDCYFRGFSVYLANAASGVAWAVRTSYSNYIAVNIARRARFLSKRPPLPVDIDFAPIGNRPLLAYSIASLLLGGQLLTLGFLAELIVAYTSKTQDTYSVKDRLLPRS